MEKNELFGKKVYGFKFLTSGTQLTYKTYMDNYIGKIGIIESCDHNSVVLRFDNGDYWWYPLSLVEEHLVPEFSDNYEIC
jgi:hypothetical protein